MDISKTYAKMCEKAWEIQQWWQPEPFDINKKNKCLGDVYLHHCVDQWADDNPYDVIEVYFAQKIDKTRVVWLPRQDQLQEMLEFPTGSFKYNFWDALADLYEWSFSANWEKFKDYIPLSMEQLWLAFVMKEKYNKVWNGEEWIKGGI